jgi:hypothetical protein
LTVVKKNNNILVRTALKATITKKKKLKAIYNSSEFRSRPQYPKIVTMKNKIENFTKKKLSLNDNIHKQKLIEIKTFYLPVIKFSIK